MGEESKSSGGAFRERGFGFSFDHLVLGAKTPGAKINAFGLALNEDGGWVNIRYPAPVGMALGMTNIMTELR